MSDPDDTPTEPAGARAPEPAGRGRARAPSRPEPVAHRRALPPRRRPDAPRRPRRPCRRSPRAPPASPRRAPAPPAPPVLRAPPAGHRRAPRRSVRLATGVRRSGAARLRWRVRSRHAAKPTPVLSLISLIAGIVGSVGFFVVFDPVRRRHPAALHPGLAAVVLGFLGQEEGAGGEGHVAHRHHPRLRRHRHRAAVARHADHADRVALREPLATARLR